MISTVLSYGIDRDGVIAEPPFKWYEVMNFVKIFKDKYLWMDITTLWCLKYGSGVWDC